MFVFVNTANRKQHIKVVLKQTKMEQKRVKSIVEPSTRVLRSSKAECQFEWTEPLIKVETISIKTEEASLEFNEKLPKKKEPAQQTSNGNADQIANSKRRTTIKTEETWSNIRELAQETSSVIVQDPTSKPTKRKKYTKQTHKHAKDGKKEIIGMKFFTLRHLLLAEFNRGSSAAKAARNINTTHGHEFVAERTAQKWFARFKQGDFALVDAPRSGRPVEFDLNRLEALLKENNHLTSRELAEQLGCTHPTVLKYLEELGKVQQFGAWVSHTGRMEINNSIIGKNGTLVYCLKTAAIQGEITLNNYRASPFEHSVPDYKHLPKLN